MLQTLVGPLNRLFDILRIKVATPDDDQILASPSYEQLVVKQEA